MIRRLHRKVTALLMNWAPSEAISRAVTIPCLPSDTAYDVKCPVCSRGFLIVSDPADLQDRSLLRRLASTALAAQHNSQKTRPDRRLSTLDRRRGLPDTREVRTERRIRPEDRRMNPEDRRTDQPGRRNTDADRRPRITVRRDSGAVHPRKLFHLAKPDAAA